MLADPSAVPNALLTKRAASCSKASQCKSVSFPAHAQATCVSKKCTWKCNTEYTKVGSKCVKTTLLKRKTTTTKKKTTTKKTTTTHKKKTTTRKAVTVATAKAASAGSKAALLAAAGVTSFTGTNSGIGSWFRADSSQDSTNGHSWCGFPYTDATPGFAPSVGTMLANFGGDYVKAATAYCGLEAVVTAPNGKTKTMVIGDGFDDTWVRTPGSIDIMYDAFTTLYGKTTTNKDDVMQGVTWVLTGARNDKYKYKGAGDS